MRKVLFASGLLAGSALVMGVVVPALAQEAAGQAVEDTTTPTTSTNQNADTNLELEEIVVTADRSPKTLQKTAIAVSVISGDEINLQGRTTMDSVLQNVPATEVKTTAKGFAVSIRGLGFNLPDQNGQPSIGQNFDGVYNFRTESNAVGFYDLDRVEVLRGPQGTLYGRNASGGVVNVISTDPRLGQGGGYGTVEVGSYNLTRSEAAINVPVTDTIAMRAAFASINRDGYLSNGHEDNKSMGGRLKLLYEPNSDFSLLLGAEYSKLGGKGPGQADYSNYLAGQPLVTSDADVGDQNFRSWKIWSFLSARLGPGTFTAQPAYQEAHAHSFGDYGGNFTDAGDPASARQKSLELRYAAPTDARAQWSLGYYHYDSRNVQSLYSAPCIGTDGSVFSAPPGYSYKGDTIPAPGGCLATPVKYYLADFPSIRKNFTDAGFGQMTYGVTDSLRLIGGVRYTVDRVTANVRDPASCSPFSLYICVDGVETVTLSAYKHGTLSNKHTEYRAGAEFDVAPRSMIYATVATGNRTGGFSDDLTKFSPEKMTSYEVGSKNRFFDNRLQVNADVFYYDYKGYQFGLFSFDSNGNVEILIKNVPTAREHGAELEGEFQLTSIDNIKFSAVYLNSEVTANQPGSDLVYRGQPFPYTPKWSFKGSFSHVFDLGGIGTITPRIDGRYLSDQFIQLSPVGTSYSDEVGQKAYLTGDLSLLFSPPAGGQWSATAYVKNVNDKVIKATDGFGYLQYQPPRTYGAALTMKF